MHHDSMFQGREVFPVAKEPVHILLIEDEEAHAELVRRSFEYTNDNIRLTTASSLAQAFQHLQVMTPDLVIVDWLLPDGRGDDVLSLGKDGVFPFPVIVMTSHGDEGVAVEVMKKGALDYVVKSEHAFADMSHLVRRALREWEAITSRREAERELRESEERFRLIAETVQDVFWISTPGFQKMLYVSPAYERVWRRSRESLHESPHSFLDAVHPEDRARLTAALEAHARGEWNLEYRIIRPDGTIRWIQDRGFPIRDEHGVLLHMTGIASDITGRKTVEEALRDSEARLREAQSIAHLGHWELDIRHDVLTWSDEVYRIFGVPRESFDGNLAGFMRAVHPEDREAVSRAYEESVKTHEAYDTIHRIVRPDGEVRYVHEQCRTHYDGAGLPVRSVGTVLDVTDRQKAEEKLQETVHRLQMANKELHQFAHVSYHDLKEPLRTITITLQSLQRRYAGKLGNEGDTLIQYAVDGAARLIELIDDLLAYSRLDSEGNPPTLVDTGEALTEAIKVLKGAIDESGAQITCDSMPRVKANPALLTVLFQNLLSNAIKFRGERIPSIHVSAWQDGNEWLFAVRDNGIGIEREYFDKIFVVFQRLHKRSEYPGTGIGLAIVKKIIESHMGRLWVESEPGKGSTFCFALPA